LNTTDQIENKRTDTANTATGYTDQEGIMLPKTPQCTASIPDENKVTTEPETNQTHRKQRRRKPKVSIMNQIHNQNQMLRKKYMGTLPASEAKGKPEI
jgi:hypothetical protein